MAVCSSAAAHAACSCISDALASLCSRRSRASATVDCSCQPSALRAAAAAALASSVVPVRPSLLSS
eukprot:31429-Prymnesium_polylepis.1